MKLAKYIPIGLFSSILIGSSSMLAQDAKPKTTRILFLVDGSSSMHEDWNVNDTRFHAASELISQIMDSVISVNPDVEFGLRLFGHQHHVSKENCADTRLEVQFRGKAMQQVRTVLKNTFPKGVSPIAFSLEEAAMNDFVNNNKYAYSLILITDGAESCGGSICTVMEKLVNFKINFQPYIVSLLDYAPLQKEYECMGKYLLVTSPKDFQPVIRTILGDNDYFKANEDTKYTPITNLPKKVEPKLETPKVIVPKKVDTPVKVVKPIIQDTPKVVTAPKIDTPIKLDTPKVVKPIVIDTPKIVKPTGKQPIANLSAIKLNYIPSPRLKFSQPQKAKVATVSYKSLPPFKYEEPSTTLNIISKIDITQGKMWRMPSLYAVPVASKLQIRKLPKFVFPEEKPIQPTTPPKVDPPVSDPPKVTSTTSENETDPGTFQIFFTNGKGKYYSSMPDIEITDLATKKVVYKGKRTIAKGGAPETMKLPDGNYEIVSVQSKRKAQFTVSKGTHQRVEIIVGSGSLSFVYPKSNEYVKGYMAMVSRRFEGNIPATEHPTELVLTYEPANYHIEINTLPISIYNIDLEFDYSYKISIERNGTFQVLNENELGRIELYHESGENFIRFYEMNIYGDVEYQKVELLPGTYEVRYAIRNEEGKRTVKNKRFKIESTKTYEITLD